VLNAAFGVGYPNGNGNTYGYSAPSSTAASYAPPATSVPSPSAYGSHAPHTATNTHTAQHAYGSTHQPMSSSHYTPPNPPPAASTYNIPYQHSYPTSYASPPTAIASVQPYDTYSGMPNTVQPVRPPAHKAPSVDTFRPKDMSAYDPPIPAAKPRRQVSAARPMSPATYGGMASPGAPGVYGALPGPPAPVLASAYGVGAPGASAPSVLSPPPRTNSAASHPAPPRTGSAASYQPPPRRQPSASSPAPTFSPPPGPRQPSAGQTFTPQPQAYTPPAQAYSPAVSSLLASPAPPMQRQPSPYDPPPSHFSSAPPPPVVPVAAQPPAPPASHANEFTHTYPSGAQPPISEEAAPETGEILDFMEGGAVDDFVANLESVGDAAEHSQSTPAPPQEEAPNSEVPVSTDYVDLEGGGGGADADGMDGEAGEKTFVQEDTHGAPELAPEAAEPLTSALVAEAAPPSPASTEAVAPPNFANAYGTSPYDSTHTRNASSSSTTSNASYPAPSGTSGAHYAPTHRLRTSDTSSYSASSAYGAPAMPPPPPPSNRTFSPNAPPSAKGSERGSLDGMRPTLPSATPPPQVPSDPYSPPAAILQRSKPPTARIASPANSANSAPSHDPYAPSAYAPSGTRERSASNASVYSVRSSKSTTDHFAPPRNAYVPPVPPVPPILQPLTTAYQQVSPVTTQVQEMPSSSQLLSYAIPAQTPYAPSPSLIGANDALQRTSSRAPVISFGFGGKFVTCFHGSGTLNTGFDIALASRQTTNVEVRTLHALVPASALESGNVSFPGPLLGDPGSPTTSLVRPGASAQIKSNKAKVAKYLEERALEIAQGIPYLEQGSATRKVAEGQLVLVRLLKVMIENDGQLSGR
jgi:hypothetical protein